MSQSIITLSQPPKTKYEITVEEFLKAARGEPFNETEWFYKKKEKEIKEEKELGGYYYYLNNEQEYIVLKRTRCILSKDENFLYLLKIGNPSYKPAFIFLGCILPDIFLNNSLTDVWLFIHTYVQGYIRIGNNSQSGYIVIDNNSQSGDIAINNNSQSGDIRIDNSQCKSIHIDDNSQSGNINIGNNSRSGDIWILNSSQSRGLWIHNNSQSGEIWINNNSQSGDIWIHNNSQSGDIAIENNSQCKNISIRNNGQSGDIDIQDSKATKINISNNFCNVLLHNATIPIMQVSNCNLHHLTWQAGSKGELYIDNCSINHLNLYKTALLKDAVISIINSKIYIAQLQELLVQGQLILRNIELMKNPFEWTPEIIKHIAEQKPQENASPLVKTIYNAKKELLNQQKKKYDKQLKELETAPELNGKGREKPLFRIANSSLGKTEITGSDLSEFHFEYRDSKLLEIFISGTKLPKEKIGIYNESPENDLPDRVFHEQKVSIYNQLKKIYDNQGDIVEASLYHSKAMRNQQRVLKLAQEDNTDKTRREGVNEWFELKAFQLNNFSNNHGESWSSALCFIFIVSIAFYSIYYICLFHNRSFSTSGIGDFIADYFSFLDPLHKIDFLVEKKEVTPAAKIVDFIGRLMVGYGIYQFIAAFRRHGRKGG